MSGHDERKRVDGVTVVLHGGLELPKKTLREEVALAKERAERLKIRLQSVQFYPEPDGYSVEYCKPAPGFERIRRITGYLVGTLDRFNDAKRAEEHDRVKHGVRDE